MEIGIAWNTAYHGTDGGRMGAVAALAEELGFSSFVVCEHIAFYPGAELGGVPVPPQTAVADPLESLAFVAATTRRIALGTAVLLLPYHHPVVLAKRLATLDVLARGRLRLVTVGLGSLPGEAAAVGVDFRSRGRRADEAIDVLRLLWSGGPEGVSHTGEFFSFERLCSYPKPFAAPGMPVHVGGSSRAAARRAGRRGDGWFPGGRMSAAERADLWALVRSEATAAGRDPAALSYTRWGVTELGAEDVAALAGQGVDRLVVSPGATELADQRRELEQLARRVSLG